MLYLSEPMLHHIAGNESEMNQEKVRNGHRQFLALQFVSKIPSAPSQNISASILPALVMRRPTRSSEKAVL